MTRVIKAIYEGGILRPLEPLDLPDRSEVEITVPAPEPHAECSRPQKRLLSFAGVGRSGRRDVAEKAEELLRAGFTR